MALGVLELKRAGVGVTQGIRQNIDNQQHRFVRPFFTTVQVILAGNDSQGLWYGTTKTPEKYYLQWKEEGYQLAPGQNILDDHLRHFCTPDRLLEFIHDFVIFDHGTKKLCRPNQFFGVKAAQQHISRREGGIIWHTQGSGKSLTMVWLAKWIRENQQDARLLIITDRTELDEQIEKVFQGVDEQIYRTKSARDLMAVLNESHPWLLCTLIHKFAGHDGDDEAGFLRQLSIPADFSPKGNFFVFIDECHRTQSGALHAAMKELLPEALFIGFTGTPLLKSDKKKSIEIFGPYIHTYKFDEAVRDGVVLDLLYEARDIDQKISDQKGVDGWFEEVTRGMNSLPKAELKQKWGTLQKILSTKDRLQKIAFDIIKDFRMKPRLNNGRGNAMLVCSSIYEACRYYQLFQEMNFPDCAIVTSFEPSVYQTKGESTGTGDTEKIEQYEIYQQMLNGRDRERFEKEVKKKFIEQPANMKLLIVVDKLLTGFDAPACTYLYIDKEMRDHGLFQAICRVNRTEQEDKEFGYIVDYKDLFHSLDQSIKDYTSGAFDDFDREDVGGLLQDRLEKARERLEDALETLDQLCSAVEPPKDVEQYLHFFIGDTADEKALKDLEERRLTFYKAVVSLIRAYNNIAPEMEDAGYSPAEAARIERQVNEYTELRNTIKTASDEYIDLKQYEPDMRQLLDMYLRADHSRTLSNFGDASLLQIIVEKGMTEATNQLPQQIRQNKNAVAETLEANMRKVIIQEMPINPVYYEKMSTLLNELIHQRRQHALDYEIFLKKMEDLARKVQPGIQAESYPEGINTPARQALYEILDEEIAMVCEMDDEIKYIKKENWIGSTIKEREVRNVIAKHLKDPSKVDEVLDLVKQQKEYK
jgi:type I restriction enzyme, R subunit